VNREQCRGCIYFIAGGGGQKVNLSEKFCHHLLHTDKRRVVGEDEKCLSRTTKRQKKAKK
jgi:hypothetical protein